MKVLESDIKAALLWLDGQPSHPGVELSIPGNIVEGMRELPSLGLAEWVPAKGYKLTKAGLTKVCEIKKEI